MFTLIAQVPCAAEPPLHTCANVGGGWWEAHKLEFGSVVAYNLWGLLR